MAHRGFDAAASIGAVQDVDARSVGLVQCAEYQFGATFATVDSRDFHIATFI